MKKITAVGVLAGGVALTGLAGSAYAEGRTPSTTAAAKPAAVAFRALKPGGGPVTVLCEGKAVPGKPVTGLEKGTKKGPLPGVAGSKVAGKPQAVVRVFRAPAGAAPVLPPGRKGTAVRVLRPKGAVPPPPGAVTVIAPKGGAPAKALHCSVQPGKPGLPPPATR